MPCSTIHVRDVVCLPGCLDERDIISQNVRGCKTQFICRLQIRFSIASRGVLILTLVASLFVVNIHQIPSRTGLSGYSESHVKLFLARYTLFRLLSGMFTERNIITPSLNGEYLGLPVRSMIGRRWAHPINLTNAKFSI